jgi:hypothetical protein
LRTVDSLFTSSLHSKVLSFVVSQVCAMNAGGGARRFKTGISGFL